MAGNVPSVDVVRQLLATATRVSRDGRHGHAEAQAGRGRAAHRGARAAAVDAERAARLAAYAKALGDPIRVQLVDVLAAHPGQLCACELLPLFDVAQSTLAHHLKKLADAGILEGTRQGLFVHYVVRAEALAALSGWLESTSGGTS